MLEPTGFREIARSATVTYPIPFIFALCLALTILALGGAVLVEPPLRWVMVGFAGFSVFFASGLVTAITIYRPGLLRSERQEIVHRVLDMLGDNQLDRQTIEAVLREPETEKKPSTDRGLNRRTGDGQ